MRLFGLVFGLAVALVACSDNSPKCIAGASVACTGPGGCAGGQVCNADGTYGVCMCGSPDAGPHDAGPPDDGSTADMGADAGPVDAATPDGDVDATVPDAGPPACNPVAQTGCATGERCTWVRTAAGMGHVACLADGTVATLGACTVGAFGETTGFDDCRSGLVCAAAICTPICDTTATAPSGYVCQTATGLFTDDAGMATTVGFGSPRCDPLAQTRMTDGAAACGSADPAHPTLGCYGAPGNEFTCVHAGDPALTDGVDARGSVGAAFTNSCAPGFQPLLVRSSTDMTPICVALCQPAPSSSSSPGTAIGVAPYSCPLRGAGGTHECRYWWTLATDPTMPIPHGNTLGYCLDYTMYTFGTPPVGEPSCTVLDATTDLNADGYPDLGEVGCQPMP